MRAAVVLMGFFLFNCAKPSEPRTANPHRDAARAVLEAHCGDCHREDSPLADANALRIYNLNDPEWPAAMTTWHVRDLLVQFEDRSLANPTMKPDLPTIRDFVKAELTVRGETTEIDSTM